MMKKWLTMVAGAHLDGAPVGKREPLSLALSPLRGARGWTGALLAVTAGWWLGGAAAQGQQYGQVPVTQQGNALPNGMSAWSTNGTPSDPIGLTRYGDVTLVLQYNLAGYDGTGGQLLFSFAQSADGTNFSSTPPLTLGLRGNGTNTVTLVTNVAVGSVGYLELFSIGNSTTNAATNITVQAWVKPKRNG